MRWRCTQRFDICATLACAGFLMLASVACGTAAIPAPRSSPPIATAKAKAAATNATIHTVSVDVKHADLRDLLALLGRFSGTRILVVDDRVAPKLRVSVKVSGAPFEAALIQVLKAGGISRDQIKIIALR